MDNMKIVSLNVRGLNNGMKRRKIYRFLKKQGADVCFLQETHCSKEKENIYASEWGNKILYSNGNTNSKGVAILFSKKLANNVMETRRDLDGRCIHVKLKINEYTYGLTNIYAPNDDQPDFFQSVFNTVNDMDCVYNMIGGDFNVVRDGKLDRSVNRIYHPKSKNCIDVFMAENNYVDIWRAQNDNKKFFTYMSVRDKLAWARIDYFIVSGPVSPKCIHSEILPSVNTDHSLISLIVNVAEGPRGPGVWKFNNELLNDKNFVTTLKDVVEGCKRVYCYLSATELWEMIKFEIKQFSREWARNKACKQKQNEFNLYTKLSNLQQELIEINDADKDLLHCITRAKHEIDANQIVDAKKAAFRCKKTWYAEGEKMSSYFFNLEKRNYISKTMYIARRHDGTLTKDYREILNMQVNFYDQLYSKDDSVKFDIENTSGIFLSEYRKNQLENEISIDELFDATMTLRKNKCPGLDGLSLEVYQTLWHNIKSPLYDNYLLCIDKGYLNESARRGIINLIPKKNRDELEISQWRPISILNVDFKIWAKAIANRLEETTDLIGLQQTGFIKGRNLAENILTTKEVVSYLNKKGLPGIVVTIDFEKCFDRIAFESIKGVFKYFGFGNEFIKRIFLLFSNLRMCTNCQGFTSEYFSKDRGINQGDPASPLIYSYCGEIMSHLILGNPNIRGLDLYGIKKILAQFADDTAAYLNYDRITVEQFTDTLSYVERLMGLKVSYEKTVIYRVGSLYKTNAQLYTQKNYVWSDRPIELLGVHIPCDNSPSEANFTEILCKIKQVCSNWYNRNLTLYGKNTGNQYINGFVVCVQAFHCVKFDQCTD